MPVSEIKRTKLVNRLVTVIGEEPTEILMKCILPDGRDQLATKDDLKALETTLRGEFQSEVGKLRGEFNEFRAETRGEFAALRAETRGEISQLRGYIDSALGKQMRLYVMLFVGFMVTNWGVVLPFLIAQ